MRDFYAREPWWLGWGVIDGGLDPLDCAEARALWLHVFAAEQSPPEPLIMDCCGCDLIQTLRKAPPPKPRRGRGAKKKGA